MLTLVKINGIDVSSTLVNYEYERTFGDLIGEVNLKFIRTVNSLVTLTAGQTIDIWRGWVTSTDEKIFSGYIERFEPEGGIILVTGLDKIWDLVRTEITKSYDSAVDPSAGKISDIFLDIVTTYGGLLADATSVQDSGAGTVLEKFVCNHADPFDRCKALANALDWQFYYRADTNLVYFEPKGFTTNPNTLTVGTEIQKVPKWNYDITEMINDLTLLGAYQEVDTTEIGRIGTTSGYNTTDVTITFEPIGTKVYADAANPPTTLKLGGVVNSTASYYYYVDKVNKKIMPKPTTTFTATNYFKIDYSYAQPIPIRQFNDASIALYGLFTKTITLTDIRSVDDAEARATNMLAKYSTPFIFTTLRVINNSTLDLKVGDKITIVDNLSIPVVNEDLVINKHRIRYPADYDEIDVGDKYWRLAEFQSNVMEKLKRLEEQELQNQDLLTNIVTGDNTSVSPIVVDHRYTQIQTQIIGGGDIFILGNPDYDVLGTNKLGSTDRGASTDYFIMQKGNVYTETFYDNDFKDTTTATWNNSTPALTFTSGQVAKSKSIDFGNGTITAATMTVTKSSGTFTYEMTANGGANWEACTTGVSLAFANTGTDLRWRITESGASTGTVTQVLINAYH
jgi:hypothetical protein